MKNTDVLTLIHSKEKVSFYTGKSNNPMSFFQNIGNRWMFTFEVLALYSMFRFYL